ncbi:hypothetical protein LguiB_027165 [Lonicera macranthoides]
MMGRDNGHFLFVSFVVVALALMSFDLVCVQAAETLPPPAAPRLIRQYYKKTNTCENAENFVKHQGCDGSILLDGPNTEKFAPQNSGLGKEVFIVIDKIKTVLEDRCPGVVSCADILNLATRDALSYVRALRSTGSSPGRFSAAANQFVASANGAHTMGKTHCSYIQDRLHNFNKTGKPDPSMKKSVFNDLTKQCSKGSKNPTVELNPDNFGPNYKFTNSYYTRVLAEKSILGVDQQLKYGNESYQLVDEYSRLFEKFRRRFALSINRMAAYKVLTGTKGEIRKKCSIRNT